MNTTLLFSILMMAAIGLLLGVIIGFFAKIFRIDVDNRVELVTELLPGANCGGCGKAGCADFAKAVVAGELSPNKCPVSSAEAVSAIALALGVDAGDGFKQKAVVLCGGDKNQTVAFQNYNGIADCVSASLVAGGPKGCSYGCLGLSSCARKCPFNAIEMINNLAIVHPELCVGCGACVAICPRKLIKLVPADAQVHVYCSSPAKAPVKKKYCNVPCIGCRKCAKAAPEKFTIDGFKATVNYQSSPLADINDVAAADCPTGCLLTESKHLEIEISDPNWSKETK